VNREPHAKYLGQRLFSPNVIIQAYRCWTDCSTCITKVVSNWQVSRLQV